MSERQVKITLVVDEKGAVRAMHTAGDESEHTTRKFESLDKGIKGMGKSFGGLKSAIGYGLGGLGVGALAFGLKDVVNTTKSLADETEKFNSITGMSAGSSLAYTAALKARGIGATAGGNAFKFLAKNIEAAERQEHSYNVARGKAAIGGKAYTGLLGVQGAAFQQLGINVAELKRLAPEDQLKLVTERFEGMQDGAEKTALATQVFGRGGTALLPVLDKGSLSLKHYMEMTKKFFPSLKGEGVKSLDELREKQSESSLAWEGLQFTLGMKVVPTMTAVMSEASKLALAIERGKGPWGAWEKDIEGVWTAGKDVVGFLEKMGKAFNIPVGAGGLGAALMTFAGIHGLKHPIKSAGLTTRIAKDIVKGVKGDPLGDISGAGLLGRAVPIAGRALFSTAGADVSALAILGYSAYRFPGALGAARKNLSLKEAMGIVPGSAGEAQWLKEHAGPQGKTQFQGRPAAGAMTPSEATQLSRLLQHPNLINRHSTTGLSRSDLEYLARQFQKANQAVPQTIIVQLHTDGVKQAETMVRNPGARKILSEGVTHEAQMRAARK
jgi:hypothetical protein